MDQTLIIMLVSQSFLLGAILAAFVLLGMGRVTFRFQQVAPRGRMHYQKITVERGFVWHTIEPWYKQGWDIVNVEGQRGVGVYTVVLKKFE